jgi:glycosyltransferase involved in cell wall biosynthesis
LSDRDESSIFAPTGSGKRSPGSDTPPPMHITDSTGKTDVGNGPAERISIITVVFNGVRTLEATIQSVLNQTNKNIEYIIIDGGSTDGSIDIIRKYERGIFYWTSEPDKGIYDAMNKGVEKATGQWINFMNSGDRFAAPDVLDLFSYALFDADILYGDAIIEYPTFRTSYEILPLTAMWRQMAFCHQASFVRTTVMKEKRFDLTYELSADFDFMYHAYRNGKNFLYLNKLICFFDFKEGASRNNALQSIYERRKSVLAHGYSAGKWLYYFFFILYFNLSVIVKGIAGEKLTAWITRSLKT